MLIDGETRILSLLVVLEKGSSVTYKLIHYHIVDMSMALMRSLKSIGLSNGAFGVVGSRTFAAGGAKKKGPKGGAGDGPKAELISKEVKSTTAYGANILKEGQDPKLLADSEYPDWLWHLLDKRPALSELRRKKAETLPFEDLKRLAKLDNRARIKANNLAKAKN